MAEGNSKALRMDDLKLVSPAMTHAEDIAAFRAESLADAPHINGGGGLENYDDPQAWVDHCANLSHPATLPEGYVEAEEWMLLRDDVPRILGLVNIRRSIENDYLREYAGHIGYAIRPAERGKGLAKAQLLLALDRCRTLGLSKVLLTCDSTNEPSRRTILACGGAFERLAVMTNDDGTAHARERYWIDIPDMK